MRSLDTLTSFALFPALIFGLCWLSQFQGVA